MKKLYAISGVTGMTGNELVRQILADKSCEDHILGFDNFYASSIETVSDCIDDDRFETSNTILIMLIRWLILNQE